MLYEVITLTRANETLSFAYDSAGRLLSADSASWSRAFTYDLLGNRLSQTSDGLTEYASYQPRITSYNVCYTKLLRTATAVSDSAIDLLWADSANNEDGYRVERSPNGSSWSTIATKGANSISHSDTNLIASTLYYYRVAAFNTAGDSGFASASATTDDPPPFVV